MKTRIATTLQTLASKFIK